MRKEQRDWPKGRTMRKRAAAAALAGMMVMSSVNVLAAEMPTEPDVILEDQEVILGEESELSIEDVESIQAYTDETFYGTGVVKVVITYKAGTDLTGVTKDSYVLEDRGTLNPDYGQVAIADAVVEGNVVTLTMADDTQATSNNKLIYTGADKEGGRERNAFGVYCTGAWYRDTAGKIHFGTGDESKGYEANTSGMGYQARESLELRLRHIGEDTFAADASLVDEKGAYNENGLWAPTIDLQLGENGFKDLYDLKIPSTAATVTDGTRDDYVQGYYYVPENYNPENGIVFTLQGQGISYWKMEDGTDDKGTGFKYDSATYSWADNGAIVVNIHDRSSVGAKFGTWAQVYDFIRDDVTVMKYFLDKYEVTGEIVLQGNSRGTAASSSVIQALAGCEYKKNGSGELIRLDKEEFDFTIDTFICMNGMLGRNIWTDEDYETIAATGMRVWVFDGEQDTNNIDTVTKYTDAAKKNGKDEEWIDENIRHTAYPSELYAYWGESDHSTTRINGWYFDDAVYYGPNLSVVDGEIVYDIKLNAGDTYTVLARGASRDGGMEKTGHEYKVYGEVFQEWALEFHEDDVESDLEVSAITKPGDFGQKLKAVIIKYPEIVDESKLTKDSFVVRAEKNNLTGEQGISTIERVYTNDKPELLEEGSKAGQYVIIETNDLDKVGLVADQYYYEDADGNVKSIAVRKDLKQCYNISVIQKDDVKDADGKVIAAASKRAIAIDQDAIDHDVLDEFQYEFLDDEQANAILKKFTFKNNNNPYSLSSNTTKYDHTTLTDEDRLGDLNEATLSGLGVRFWYQLPDNYDPNKKYPLFLFAHGTGESMTTAVTGDGEVLTNHGCHFNIGNPTGIWATTEDYGYEDVIVVAPQYYSGNSPRPDGYERDDAFRVALCYALDKFSVDRDRVYVSGTSQGAGRTTALVRDCAEYITAAIVQNGGYSSKLSADKNLDAVKQHEDIFKFATDNDVAIWFFQGVNDFISKPLTAETMYNALINNYKAAGKSDEWLQDNARFTYLNNKIYLDMNETSYHSTMKPTYRWYAYYKDALYRATYSDAEDSLGEYFDTKYGNNDPDGYKGLIDWTLSKRKAHKAEEPDPITKEKVQVSVYNDAAGVQLKWNKVAGADGYIVYRKASTDKKYGVIQTIKSGKTVSFLDKTAKNGVKYAYAVRAFHGKARSEYKAASIVRVASLKVPTVAASLVKKGVQLKWYKVSGAEGYIVYRKTAGQKYAVVATIKNGNTRTFVDTKVKSGTKYAYAVRAYNGKVRSGYKAQTVLVLSQPAVKASRSGRKVTISWNKVSGAKGYYVYKKNAAGDWVHIATIKNGSTVKFKDNNGKKGNTYAVRAFNGTTRSSYEPVTVK